MTTEQRKAVLVIRNYLNKDLEDNYILENYDLAVEQLINNAAKLENIKTPGVKSMSEGNQSISFESGASAWSITEDVKALLPTPYARMW
ncbi:hypothetical protein FDC22_01225 [Clostridium botulinum]|uniref:Phage gp6-like head-tail connector protein n=1 Tax=Clostridium botulinum (strain Okra / Type B1) TaxID=498213 RepID=B1IGA2_CLOBK|nr:hypothetical protein [Clostridium botulinum]EKX80448.1 hypothetical protein CFSAN001628_006544 [Clostridium botulinum CFSAN001628]ACA45984.1 conserved hypothetical protein [Clostridium botulinum B1 str. Okra]MBD5564504.1 hypothetical protein [Clostridium botulinum]MBD5566579.1 hypothetical protein [Clostridium botulinum]MBD5568905.1 hypothetical protein [Clostridium botulinum]